MFKLEKKSIKKTKKVVKDVIKKEPIVYSLIDFNTPNYILNYEVEIFGVKYIAIKDIKGKTFWFEIDVCENILNRGSSAISMNIVKLIRLKEIENSTVQYYQTVALDGRNRDKMYINLKALCRVGMKMRKKKGEPEDIGAKFRDLSDELLHKYFFDEYIVNPKISEENKKKLSRDLITLRTEEKALYKEIKDLLKYLILDYDSVPNKKLKDFFSHLQDLFYYCATGKTAKQILLERCKPEVERCGLLTGEWSKKGIIIAKNFLNETEILDLEDISFAVLIGLNNMKRRGTYKTFEEMVLHLRKVVDTFGYKYFEKWDYPSGLPDRDELNKKLKGFFELNLENSKNK